jgi:hypothetical protein
MNNIFIQPIVEYEKHQEKQIAKEKVREMLKLQIASDVADNVTDDLDDTAQFPDTEVGLKKLFDKYMQDHVNENNSGKNSKGKGKGKQTLKEVGGAVGKDASLKKKPSKGKAQ